MSRLPAPPYAPDPYGQALLDAVRAYVNGTDGRDLSWEQRVVGVQNLLWETERGLSSTMAHLKDTPTGTWAVLRDVTGMALYACQKRVAHGRSIQGRPDVRVPDDSLATLIMTMDWTEPHTAEEIVMFVGARRRSVDIATIKVSMSYLLGPYGSLEKLDAGLYAMRQESA